MSAAAARRVERLRELMAAADTTAVLVTDLTDVRYLSGFSGSNGALLVLFDEVVLATDGRYRLQAQREAPAATLIVTRQLIAELLGHAGQRGVSQIGFGAASMSVATWQRIAAEFPDVSLVATDVDVSGLRAVKDDEELASVREACAISVRALARLLDEIKLGMGEIEIARRLELLMGLEGAPDRSFDSIVAGGPHSAIPHHQPTDRPIAAGDLLKIDFGALFEGYHADCTRTFVVAAEPADWQVEIHAVVATAQRAGMNALAPGADAQAVDVAARSVIEDAGYGYFYGHGRGHGVGLENHEVRFLGPTSTNT